MPRGKPPEGITIGFLGTGEMEADPATDLIEEFLNESIKPDEPAKFIFPLTQDEFSDSLAGLADMARKSKIRYEVITNAEDKKRRAFTTIAQGSAHQWMATDVFTQMETLLVEAPRSVLFVLWDEKRDDELQAIVGKFIDAEIQVMDLTNNLAVVGVEGDEGEAPDEAEEEEAGEEPDLDVEAEAEDEDEAEEPVADDTAAYTRAQMEKMSHADVKAIAVGMDLPPRKEREKMIVAILEKQGTPEVAAEAPVRSQAVPVGPVDDHAPLLDLTGLRDILDEFGSRFFMGLDEWLTKFSEAAEGFAFNVKPEEPMDVEEPEEAPRVRRLSRTPRAG